MPGPKFRALTDDRNNMDILTLIAAAVIHPDRHTGEVNIRLFLRDGKIMQATFGLTDLIARARPAT